MNGKCLLAPLLLCSLLVGVLPSASGRGKRSNTVIEVGQYKALLKDFIGPIMGNAKIVKIGLVFNCAEVSSMLESLAPVRAFVCWWKSSAELCSWRMLV